MDPGLAFGCSLPRWPRTLELLWRVTWRRGGVELERYWLKQMAYRCRWCRSTCDVCVRGGKPDPWKGDLLGLVPVLQRLAGALGSQRKRLLIPLSRYGSYWYMRVERMTPALKCCKSLKEKRINKNIRMDLFNFNISPTRTFNFFYVISQKRFQIVLATCWSADACRRQ